MIIISSHETINKTIEFLCHNSGYVELYFGAFDYIGDDLIDLLTNCDKIENVDYSKFIIYIMLNKFCPDSNSRLLPTSSSVIPIQNIIVADLFVNAVLINSCDRDFADPIMNYIVFLKFVASTMNYIAFLM